MIPFADGLLATLAAPRPHIIQSRTSPTGIIASCTCGQWSYESMGKDESSRSAVKAAVRRHEKEAAL